MEIKLIIMHAVEQPAGVAYSSTFPLGRLQAMHQMFCHNNAVEKICMNPLNHYTCKYVCTQKCKKPVWPWVYVTTVSCICWNVHMWNSSSCPDFRCSSEVCCSAQQAGASVNASERGRFLQVCETCAARVNVVPSAPAEPAAPCRRHPALSAVSLSSGAAEPASEIHTETERSAEKASEKVMWVSCGWFKTQ